MEGEQKRMASAMTFRVRRLSGSTGVAQSPPITANTLDPSFAMPKTNMEAMDEMVPEEVRSVDVFSRNHHNRYATCV